MTNAQVFLHWVRGYLDCADMYMSEGESYRPDVILRLRNKAEECYCHDIEDSAIQGKIERR